MTAGGVVGVIANPASARDIRRLVASGAAVTTNHKLNMLSRLLAGLSAAGVDRVVSMRDLGGVRPASHPSRPNPADRAGPSSSSVTTPSHKRRRTPPTPWRKCALAGSMPSSFFGGDGTNRVVADCCGPIHRVDLDRDQQRLSGSDRTHGGRPRNRTGCNGRVDPAAATRCSKILEVQVGNVSERALVDVAILSGDQVGSGAIWEPTAIRSCCFWRSPNPTPSGCPRSAPIYVRFAETNQLGFTSGWAVPRPIGSACRWLPAC